MQVVRVLLRGSFYIECRDNGYFTWIFSFFTLFCLLVQVAYSMPPEKCLLLRLLGQSTSILKLSSMYWVKTNEGMGLSTSSGWAYRALFCTQISPLPQNTYTQFYKFNVEFYFPMVYKILYI